MRLRGVTWTLPNVPAAYFSMVIGLTGLRGAWNAGHEVWGLPASVGEVLGALAAVVWLLLLVPFVLKWYFAREQALAEVRHPIYCCFLALVGVATMAIAQVSLTVSRELAQVLFAVGAIFSVVFAVWLTGNLWQGDREIGNTTPALYLPTVASAFVIAIVSSSLGRPDWGTLAFGAGLFSWLAIESVLLHRLYTAANMPSALRPALGIQPTCIGAVAYLSINGGVADKAAYALVGYGLLEAALLIRLLPWILNAPFTVSYWAFTFGASALATACVRMAGQSSNGAMNLLAPLAFTAANVIVAFVLVGTFGLIARGRLLVAAQPAPQCLGGDS